MAKHRALQLGRDVRFPASPAAHRGPPARLITPSLSGKQSLVTISPITNQDRKKRAGMSRPKPTAPPSVSYFFPFFDTVTTAWWGPSLQATLSPTSTTTAYVPLTSSLSSQL